MFELPGVEERDVLERREQNFREVTESLLFCFSNELIAERPDFLLSYFFFVVWWKVRTQYRTPSIIKP